MLSYPTVLPRKRWHPIRAHTSVRPYAFFINSAQVFLDDVGANPRVRPAALSCHTDFGEENDVVLFAGDRWSPLLSYYNFSLVLQKQFELRLTRISKNKRLKNPVFMRLFSMFSACFLFETFNDNITARQFIIIANSGKIHFFSVKRDSNRILLYIILLKYNIIANNLK